MALLTAILLLTASVHIQAIETNQLLAAWLAAQTHLQSWSAQFTQTRTLKALVRPLTTPGRVWFVAPDQFRWELGEPAQTIAVRQSNQVLVIYPRLLRAERYPLGAGAGNPLSEALTLFEAGFPRDRADLDRRFRILSQTARDAEFELVLQPRAASARRLMPEIRIVSGRADHSLRATELKFADGSMLRNDFTNALINPAVEPARFDPRLGPEFKVVEPLPRRGP